jgi:hypothetical protein
LEEGNSGEDSEKPEKAAEMRGRREVEKEKRRMLGRRKDRRRGGSPD